MAINYGAALMDGLQATQDTILALKNPEDATDHQKAGQDIGRLAVDFGAPAALAPTIGSYYQTALETADNSSAAAGDIVNVFLTRLSAHHLQLPLMAQSFLTMAVVAGVQALHGQKK